MMQHIKIINRATYVILALVIIGVIYFTYQKPVKVHPELVVTQRETFTALVQTKMPLRDSIVSFGRNYLGTPYVTAGCSENGFDCSGFVYFVFQHFDITVPRSSANFEHFGKEISIDAVQKGDLLLFLSPTRNAIGHIGIVSKANGMKSDFIHATSGREMQVVVTNLTNKGYTQRFVKAIRVIKP